MKQLLFLALTLTSAIAGFAATTIDVVNKYAYGANLGWMDWTGGTANGAVIGDYVCMGYLQKILSLGTPAWLDSGLGLISPDGASTTRGVADINTPMRFYRVRVVRPLAP